MKLTTLVFAFSLLSFAPTTLKGQGPPDLKPREGQIVDKTSTSKSSFTLMTQQNTSNATNAKVAEDVSLNPGPVGELYLVAGLNDYIKAASDRHISHIYPSLIFDLSASPLLKRVEKDGKKKVDNTDLNLVWRDVTVTLSATCKQLDDRGMTWVTKECNEAISVIEVLPNATESGQKDSVPAQIAAAVSGLGTAAAPFFPASTFNEKVAAAGDGLTVLFRNLFPPKTQTYFHAFMGDPRTFGWNFRENNTTPNGSLLGLNRGIVLLKARKDVVKIDVHCELLSKWNKDLVEDPYNHILKDWTYELPEVKDNAIDYDSLVNLNSFPALIHKGEVLNILHLVDDNDYARLKTDLNLTAGNGLDSVQRLSLRNHLLALNYSPGQVKDIISGYPESVSKPDVIQLVCLYNYTRCPSRGIPPEIVFLGEYAQRSSIEKYLGLEKREERRR
jgi:hypothetical protein